MTDELAAPERTDDLPGELLEILDFAALVREFASQTGFAAKLPSYLKLYQAEAEKMRPSASQMVGDLLLYLHTRPQLYTVSKEKVEIADPKNRRKKFRH